MNRRIITIIIVLAAMCGGASAQQPVDKNNQESVRLQQQSEARVKGPQGQVP